MLVYKRFVSSNIEKHEKPEKKRNLVFFGYFDVGFYLNTDSSDFHGNKFIRVIRAIRVRKKTSVLLLLHHLVREHLAVRQRDPHRVGSRGQAFHAEAFQSVAL